MISILKTLVEVLKEVKTPLLFWSFLALCILVGFYIFSKNNDWFKSLIMETTSALSRLGLYKIFRLIVICAFVLILLLIILTFSAPIIDRYIENKYEYSNTFDQIDRKLDNLNTDVQIDEKYSEIIKYYERGDFENATYRLKDAFGIDDFKNDDEKLGYFVAAYVGNQQFDKAAEEVLKRDIERPKWDMSLKLDLAYCIRRYNLRNTLFETFSLIENLQLKFGSKLISKFWALIPSSIIGQIEKGEHSLYFLEGIPDDQVNNLKALIKKYPKDRFVDHAYYALQEYELGLKESGLIKDVLIYAAGYRLLSELKLSHGLKRWEFNSKAFVHSVNDSSFINCVNHFKSYVNTYPDRPHADDSAFWLGFLYSNAGDFEASLNWFSKVNSLGNGDYNYYIETFLAKIIPELPNDLIDRFLDLLVQKKSFAPFNYNEIINSLVYSGDSSAVLRRIRTLQQGEQRLLGYVALVERFNNEYKWSYSKGIYSEFISDYDAYIDSGNYDELSNWEKTELTEIEKRAKYLAKQTDLVLSYSESELNYQDMASLAISFRHDFYNRKLALYFIDLAVKKFGNNPSFPLDYFIYLMVANLRDQDPVEAIRAAETLLKNFPSSQYCDDVMADIVYIQAIVLDKRNDARKTLNTLVVEYPDGNALDNAHNWLAMSLRNCCEYYYSCSDDNARYGSAEYRQEKKAKCDEAKALYKEIIRKFPDTRFALYAVENIQRINKRLYY